MTTVNLEELKILNTKARETERIAENVVQLLNL